MMMLWCIGRLEGCDDTLGFVGSVTFSHIQVNKRQTSRNDSEKRLNVHFFHRAFSVCSENEF